MKRIVPVSGGKDSQAVLSMVTAEFGTTDVVAVHQNTGYDHPLTYDHLRYMEDRYRVPIIHTRSAKYEDVFDFIEKAGYFPNNAARGCTSRLKQRPFADWLRANEYTKPGSCRVYLGMRADESARRSEKYGAIAPDEVFYLPEISSEYNSDFNNVEVCLPVVEWTTEMIFAYLRGCGDEVNPLYAKDHDRVGCYPCLLAKAKEWRSAVRDPIGRANVKRLLEIQDRFIAEGNPRKFIKVHPTRDVRALLRDADAELGPEADTGCGWCSI